MVGVGTETGGRLRVSNRCRLRSLAVESDPRASGVAGRLSLCSALQLASEQADHDVEPLPCSVTA